MFSPIYLPFIKPVCELCIIVEIALFTQFAITFVAILLSTFNRLIGLQFPSDVISLFCLGMSVIILCFCKSVREPE